MVNIATESGVTSSTSSTQTQVTVTPSSETGAIQGKAYDKTNPIQGVIVSIGEKTDTTDSEGTYIIESVTPGTHTITAQKDNYQNYSDSINVTAGQTLTHNFEMSPTSSTSGTVKGKVTDSATSDPIVGAIVLVGNIASTTDADGNYTLNGVSVGTGQTITCWINSRDYSHKVDINSGEVTSRNFDINFGYEDAGDTDSSGDCTSIALDASGNPRITYYYYNWSWGDLKYAQRNDGVWSSESVDTQGNTGRNSSLALDSSGNPHISYLYETDRNLKYSRWDGSQWNNETVDSTGDSGWYSSLALDSSGNPHISYESLVNFNEVLKYARWDGEKWNFETVDSTGHTGYYTSLALDKLGHPHIAYADNYSDPGYQNKLKYARWNGQGWIIQTLDTATDEAFHNCSLVLDSSGNPHIAYESDYDSCLKYARWDGSAWKIMVVDNTGSVGRGASLTLDTLGFPHISYFDGTSNKVKYAEIKLLP